MNRFRFEDEVRGLSKISGHEIEAEDERQKDVWKSLYSSYVWTRLFLFNIIQLIKLSLILGVISEGRLQLQ